MKRVFSDVADYASWNDIRAMHGRCTICNVKDVAADTSVHYTKVQCKRCNNFEVNQKKKCMHLVENFKCVFYLKVLVTRFVFHCTSKFSYLSSNLSLVNDLTALFLVVTHPLHIASQIFLLHPLRSNRDQSTVYRWRGIGWLDSMRSAGWCRITWMGI